MVECMVYVTGYGLQVTGYKLKVTGLSYVATGFYLMGYIK